MKSACLILSEKKEDQIASARWMGVIAKDRKIRSSILSVGSSAKVWHLLFDDWNQRGVSEVLVIADKNVPKKALKESFPERICDEKERYPHFDFHYLGKMI